MCVCLLCSSIFHISCVERKELLVIEGIFVICGYNSELASKFAQFVRLDELAGDTVCRIVKVMEKCNNDLILLSERKHYHKKMY